MYLAKLLQLFALHFPKHTNVRWTLRMQQLKIPHTIHYLLLHPNLNWTCRSVNVLSEWGQVSAWRLTTGVSRTGLSRAGRSAPCARSAFSTACPLKWRAATPYTPARPNTASEHPGTTGCSPLCGPDPELNHTHTAVTITSIHTIVHE